MSWSRLRSRKRSISEPFTPYPFTDDPNWCKQRLGILRNVTVVHGSVQQDLAQLVVCDHMILTFGSFSWWAAWLNDGDVVYFDKPYTGQRASRNEKMKKRHFLPYWIPMGS